MKLSKKYLAIIGGAVLVVLVIGVGRGVKKAARCRAARRRPALARILERERPGKMLGTIHMMRLIETLELNEEQIAQVLPRMRKTREAKERRRTARKEKIKELEKLLRRKAPTQVLEKALSELRAEEEKFQARRKAQQDEMIDILTPEQQAKFILFERNFRREMQGMLRRPPRRPRQPERGRELPGPLEELPPEEGPPMERMR